MAGGTILSRLTGIGRNVAFFALGVKLLTDSYTVANNTPNMVYELVVGGVLSATLVPLFVGFLGPHGSRRDRDGVSAIVTLAVVLVIALSLLLFLAAPFVVELFISPDKPESILFAGRLLRMFAPQVALYGFVSISTSLLQSQRNFGISMLAPVVNNLIVIVVFVLAARMIDRLPDGTSTLDLLSRQDDLIRLLGWGTTLGVLSMFLVTLPALKAANLGLRPIWSPRHPAIRELLRLTGWTVGYVAANQVALAFVVRTANRGADGDLTAYTSANSTFFQLPHGVIAVSVITALGPGLSEAFLDRARARFRRMLSGGLRNLLVLMTPAAAGLMALARPLTETVLSLASDVRTARDVGDVLMWLAPGLPAFSCYLLLMGGFKAMRDARTAFEINVVENAINIVAGALLYVRFGIRGLAAGFSVAYIVAAILAFIVMSRRTAGLDGINILHTATKALVASIVMGLAVFLALKVAERSIIPAANESGRWFINTAAAAALVPLGVTVYLTVARLLGLPEIVQAVSTLRRRLGR
jgi:putative peptidoglycan lipid II flippase